MRGATAPRLLLELLCARVLLPGADHTTHGIAARLDRLERRASITGAPTAAAPTAPATVPAASPAPAQDRPAPAAPTSVGTPIPEAEPVVEAPDPAPATEPTPAPAATATPARGGGGLSLVDVRRLWPDVVESTKARRRMAWIHLTQNCQVVGLDGNVLTLGFANAGARDSFESSGCSEVVHQAAIDVVGADWKIETIVDPGAQPEGTPTISKAATDPEPAAAPAVPETTPEPGTPEAAPAWAGGEETSDPAPDPSAAKAAAREAIQQTRAKGAEAPKPDAMAAADAEASRDDLDADPDNLGGEDLLARELGASKIEEIKHS
jgi:DNA polymerase-3 subunit gamma/tau